MKKHIYTLIILCTPVFVFSQSIQWQNTIGGDQSDELNSAQMTTDGGYIMAGTSTSSMSGDKSEASLGSQDYWVVKTDNSGTIEWENTIGGADQDILSKVIQTSDGGYLLGGRSESDISGDKTENSNGGFDYWIVKLNSSGTIVWQNTIGGSDIDRFNDLIETSDGGYLVAGHSTSGISGDKTQANNGTYNFWIVKLNGAGVIQWDQTIGGDQIDVIGSVHESSTGDFLIGGYSNSGAAGDKSEASQGDFDYWLVKLNSNGSLLWEKTIGGDDVDEVHALRETNTGNFIVAGTSISGVSGDKTQASVGYDFWILEIDPSGTIQWQKTIGGAGSDELYQLDTISNGYLISGASDSNTGGDKSDDSYGGKDYWMVKTDLNGNVVKDYTFGGTDEDELIAAFELSSSSHVLVGFSQSNSNAIKDENSLGGSDYWIFKADCIAPDAPVASANQNFLCSENAGDAITLSVSSGNLNNAEEWAWYSGSCNGTPVNSGANITVNPTSTTTYYVRAEGGCPDPSTCDAVTIDVSQPFSVNVSTTDEYYGNDGAIDVTTNGGTAPYSYSWSGPNSFVSNNEDLMNLEAGTYTSVLSDDNGCDTTFDVIINSFVNVKDEAAISSFDIYPNPNQGQFNIKISPDFLGGVLVIRDMTGRKIHEKLIRSNITNIQLQDIAKGGYNITYITENEVISKKIIIQ